MADLVTDEIVIRAYWPLPQLGGRRISYGIPLMLAGIVFLGFAVAWQSRIGFLRSKGEMGLMVAALIWPVMAAWGAFFYDGTELFVNREHVILKKWFRQPIVVQVAELGKIVQLVVDTPTRNGTNSSPALFFFDRQGRCVMSLYSSRFEEDDLARLWATIGMEPEGSPMDHWPLASLNDRFPGAFDPQKAA